MHTHHIKLEMEIRTYWSVQGRVLYISLLIHYDLDFISELHENKRGLSSHVPLNNETVNFHWWKSEYIASIGLTQNMQTIKYYLEEKYVSP